METSQTVKIYTTSYCGFCSRAKQLLIERGIPFQEIDVTGDDDQRAQLVELTGQRTVPQIFIGKTYVGGYTNLAEIDREGRLTDMVTA